MTTMISLAGAAAVRCSAATCRSVPRRCAETVARGCHDDRWVIITRIRRVSSAHAEPTSTAYRQAAATAAMACSGPEAGRRRRTMARLLARRQSARPRGPSEPLKSRRCSAMRDRARCFAHILSGVHVNRPNNRHIHNCSNELATLHM